MRRRITDSWTLLYITTFGLVLLMASLRPELQREPGKDSAPGPAIAVAGHVLTWTPGAVLVYRMVRSALQYGREERAPEQRPTEDPPTEDA